VTKRPHGLRRTLGYLPQDFGFYPNLTGREFLSYLAAAKGVPARTTRRRIGELLEFVALDAAADRRLGAYSGGMLRRVGIAQALLNDPRVIILDEPTVGLDPEERSRFHSLLSDLAVDRVIILSTHIVPDVEAVAGEVAMVAGGRLLRRGSPAELVTPLEGQVWEAHVDPAALAAVQQRHTVVHALRDGELVRVRLLAQDRPFSDAAPVPPALEDAYRAVGGGAQASAGAVPHGDAGAWSTAGPRVAR
jgi:ABC-2 type transport system ATP-binding protein